MYLWCGCSMNGGRLWISGLICIMLRFLSVWVVVGSCCRIWRRFCLCGRWSGCGLSIWWIIWIISIGCVKRVRGCLLRCGFVFLVVVVVVVGLSLGCSCLVVGVVE